MYLLGLYSRNLTFIVMKDGLGLQKVWLFPEFYRIAVACCFILLKCGISPSKYVFSPLVKASSELRSLKGIKFFDDEITKLGFEDNLHLSTALLQSYSNKNCIEDALRVYNRIDKKDELCVSAILSCYSKRNDFKQVLCILNETNATGLEPGIENYTIALGASEADTKFVTGIHGVAIKCGYMINSNMVSKLMSAYIDCKRLCDAENLLGNVTDDNIKQIV